MQAGYLLRQYRTNELVRWRMHFSSDAIAELEGLTYGKSKNLQAAGAGKGIRQRCRRIVRYCPNVLFAASTRHTHGAVSYTHLDVYKRQAVGRGSMQVWGVSQ